MQELLRYLWWPLWLFIKQLFLNQNIFAVTRECLTWPTKCGTLSIKHGPGSQLRQQQHYCRQCFSLKTICCLQKRTCKLLGVFSNRKTVHETLHKDLVALWSEHCWSETCRCAENQGIACSSTWKLAIFISHGSLNEFQQLLAV